MLSQAQGIGGLEVSGASRRVLVTCCQRRRDMARWAWLAVISALASSGRPRTVVVGLAGLHFPIAWVPGAGA
jgi:hypothetical protein